MIGEFINVDKLLDVLTRLSAKFEFKPAVEPRKFSFVKVAEADRWVVIDPTPKSASGLQLWLRIEDLDTVEIVLIRV